MTDQEPPVTDIVLGGTITEQQQRNADIGAGIVHALDQKDVDGREWERQAAQWKGVADTQRARADKLEKELTYERIDAASLERQCRELIQALAVVEMERDRAIARADIFLATQRAVCDVLSYDSGTIAGQTLVEAVRAVIAQRDEARQRADQAEQEAEYWRKENRVTRDAAARTMDDALELMRPAVALESERNTLFARLAALHAAAQPIIRHADGVSAYVLVDRRAVEGLREAVGEDVIE